MTDSKQRISVTAYAIGVLSFIPGVGILFGLTAAIWGACSKRRGARIVLMMGILGIILTIYVFGFVMRNDKFGALKSSMAESCMGSTIKSLEYYKLVQGHYPAALAELNEFPDFGSKTIIYDPTKDIRLRETFYYKVTSDGGYQLFGVGPDGLPYTADDILPKVSALEQGKIGLRRQVIEKKGDSQSQSETLQPSAETP